MSLAQHQNTCPIILGLLPTEGRSTKAFLVSAVQNFPPLPFPSSFFHLLSSRKTMNGIIGRVQLSKNAEMHAERTSFFPLSAFACDGVGEGAREGRDVAIFFNEQLQQGAMHASNKHPFKRDTEERETGVLIASFHACIIRLHASNGGIISYEGARISYLYSLFDESRIMDYRVRSKGWRI